MPRFVILKHDHPRGMHYDFMLEIGESLKTWSLAEPPAIGREQRVEILPDHRSAYLDFEGIIAGGRGEVERWDLGTYRLIEQTGESLIVELFGEKMHCYAILKLDSEDSNCWKCLFAASA